MSVSPIQAPASHARVWDERSALRAKAAGQDPADVVITGAPAGDETIFSAEALALSRGGAEAGSSSSDGRALGESGQAVESSSADEALTDEERQQVEELRARDAEVRAHEAAHMAAGGSHVRGGATYSYQQGPDGKQYATGGEVGIDVSSVSGNPQATIQKMQQVRAAALAPAEPSGADRGVAAKAAQIEAQAREQLAAKSAERVTSAYAGAQEPPRGSRMDAMA